MRRLPVAGFPWRSGLRACPLLLALAGCVGGPARGPEVAVTAAREGDGLRVVFRRLREIVDDAGRRPRLEVDGGRLEQERQSPDRRTVSVLWRRPAGKLRCSFPFGGAGVCAADGPRDETPVEYVFAEAEGVRVSARLPRGALVRAGLRLRILLDATHLPAELQTGSQPVVRLQRPDTTTTIVLRARDGVLAAGDRESVIRTADGKTFPFLIGIDPDGTPTATTGYVRNW